MVPQVGTLNRTGVSYSGSFDVWIRNRISELLDWTSANFERRPVEGWVNGDNFISTQESFGILPVPAEQREKLNMYPFNAHFAHDFKPHHHYLSEKQNTQIAVLPIHTKPERILFRALLTGSQAQRQPNWEDFARDWNSHCNQAGLYYKVPTLLHAQHMIPCF